MFLFAVWAVFPAINRRGKAAAVVKTPGSVAAGRKTLLTASIE